MGDSNFNQARFHLHPEMDSRYHNHSSPGALREFQIVMGLQNMAQMRVAKPEGQYEQRWNQPQRNQPMGNVENFGGPAHRGGEPLCPLKHQRGNPAAASSHTTADSSTSAADFSDNSSDPNGHDLGFLDLSPDSSNTDLSNEPGQGGISPENQSSGGSMGGFPSPPTHECVLFTRRSRALAVPQTSSLHVLPATSFNIILLYLCVMP
mmetsp:Transcript_12480/g.24859  ORF Transcript_12480/g.24859 Transcript_12480/m.24859 type:complete len:207 (+) Transcript_12480:167-787(+)